MFKQSLQVAFKLYKIHNFMAIILLFGIKYRSVSQIIATFCYT